MFRDDFVWGTAASAYQTEGREEGDGCGQTIWDTFIAQGRTQDGYDAYRTCDHMHRYREDYKLMRLLGIQAYRFSLNWARILPEGVGQVNEKGIELYRNMILEMKKNGIEPYLTMYHWELPQALQEKGGWRNEEMIQWFGEYARVVAERFSDICENFITLNEPQCFVGLGHLSGVQAPGLTLPYKEVFQVAHNALRAHGQATLQLRKYACRPVRIGYAPTCGMAYPASEKAEDVEAARKALFGFYQPMDNWTWNVSWFSDPVFLGEYPKEGLEKFVPYLPQISPGDMELISQPLDFMGQNIYNGYMVRQGAQGEPVFVDRPAGFPKTASNWPVTPQCLYWGVKFLYERYHMPLYLTENGMSCHDAVSLDGKVHDPNRRDFLDRYLSALQKASDEGADVRGYFLWTFLDNFEWDKGYTERFGIVHVDFATQKRVVKDSAFWYRDIIASNGKILAVNKGILQAIRLEPVFRRTIWGGDRLAGEYGCKDSGEQIGECWVVSAHPNGDCTVREGVYQGKTLSNLWKEEPQLFGGGTKEAFPLLVKVIDAREDLSIQVHPDDAYAAAHENGSLGKTECWYILDCAEGASLIAGHNAATRQELKEMVEQERWGELLREIPVKKGDFIQIEPGTVHAIKGGVLLLEIQQSSDVTYRVYDYKRLADGKPRPLHVRQSLDVITVPSAPAAEIKKETGELSANRLHLLGFCRYYKVWKLCLSGSFAVEQEFPFLIMSVTQGDLLMNGQYLRKGEHLVLPSGYGAIEMQGTAEIIFSTVSE